MLYNKPNLLVVLAASTDPTRPVLNCISLEEDGSTVATDGNILIHVGPSEIRESEADPMPGFDSQEPTAGNGHNIFYGKQALNVAEALTPKAKSAISCAAKLLKTDSGNGHIPSVDMGIRKDKTDIIFHSTDEGPYPNWKLAMPKVEEPIEYEIALGIPQLKKLFNCIEKIFEAGDHESAGPSVLFKFREATQAVEFTVLNFRSQKISGVIMPRRTEI
jgi:hypothetical protein